MGELLPEELELAGLVPVNRMERMTKYEEEEEKPTGATEQLLSVPRAEPDNISIVSVTELDTLDRETWGKKIDFLLSVIGFAVDLANVWRFPYLCFRNGGGVFLIPYGLMLFLGGIPLFYMELALGQYNRQGAITTWGRICPLFKGIGYGVVMIAFYTDFFYNVIISWALRFFLASFTSTLPWSSCNNSWNSKACYEPTIWASSGNNTDDVCRSSFNFSVNNQSERISASEEYFYKRILSLHKAGESTRDIVPSVGNPGPIKWELALCLLAVYLICYFSLWKGIKMSGKVVWFTAVFPYVVLICLLIRGVTLPGAMNGVYYYLSPNLTKLADGNIWFDAATQVFFSLGPGFGVLMAYASYNKFHNNVYHDALLTSSINCGTSFLSGFVIFSVLGYMSCKSGKPIESVAAEGPGLVFVVYPEALSTMPGSSVWSVVFFLMLLTLGLDSSFGGSEAIITALSDEFPVIRRNREIFVACLFSLYMLFGLLMCTEAGLLFVEFLGIYGASWGLLIAVLCEALVVSWFYGLRRFVADIKEMLGFEPGYYWRFCWAIMGPAFMIYNLGYGFYSYKSPEIQGYKYPRWMEALGWVISFSSALAIPIVGAYQFHKAAGNTFQQKLKSVLTPWKAVVDYSPVAKDDVNEILWKNREV